MHPLVPEYFPDGAKGAWFLLVLGQIVLKFQSFESRLLRITYSGCRSIATRQLDSMGSAWGRSQVLQRELVYVHVCVCLSVSLSVCVCMCVRGGGGPRTKNATNL